MSDWYTSAESLGISLNPAQRAQFKHYEAELLAWNQKINLTAIRDPAEVRLRHFLDSLTCDLILRTFEISGHSLIDVGTGGGFPGLPLKILYPELEVTLVDSVGKKVRFLEQLADQLGLPIQTSSQRAEALGRDPAHREQHDWAVARSVAELSTLCEYLLPLCKVGGHMLAMKGDSGPEEVERGRYAIQTLGGTIKQVEAVQLPGREISHYLILIEKTAYTPETYPRRIGVPSKRPLKAPKNS